MGKSASERGVALVAALFAEWVKNYLWLLVPSVPTVLAWLSARAQHYPIWALILISSIVFWATMSGLAAGREFWSRSTVKDRLIAPGLIHRKVLGEDGKPTHLGIGTEIANISDIVLEYEVVHIHTVLDGHVDPSPSYENRRTLIQPSCVLNFWDSAVPMEFKPNKIIRGMFEIRIKYGKPGKLLYDIDLSYKISTKSTEDGFAGLQWFVK